MKVYVCGDEVKEKNKLKSVVKAMRRVVIKSIQYAADCDLWVRKSYNNTFCRYIMLVTNDTDLMTDCKNKGKND